MNHHTCNRIEHLGHYERNGTYLRVLLAIPTDPNFELGLGLESFGSPVDGHLSEIQRVTIDTTRIVILTAPNIQALDDHTARLQTAAGTVDWELRPADGLHRRIIERLHHTTVQVDQ